MVRTHNFIKKYLHHIQNLEHYRTDFTPNTKTHDAFQRKNCAEECSYFQKILWELSPYQDIKKTKDTICRKLKPRKNKTMKRLI